MFIHVYLDGVRRLRDDGEVGHSSGHQYCEPRHAKSWGVIGRKSDGLYYSNDNGDNWVLWDELKFVVMVAQAGIT